MESYDDSNTIVYLLLAVVAAASLYWFVLRERPSSDMQAFPSAPALFEDRLTPTAGPLESAITWPDAPSVDLQEEQDAPLVGATPN